MVGICGSSSGSCSFSRHLEPGVLACLERSLRASGVVRASVGFSAAPELSEWFVRSFVRPAPVWPLLAWLPSLSEREMACPPPGTGQKAIMGPLFDGKLGYKDKSLVMQPGRIYS